MTLAPEAPYINREPVEAGFAVVSAYGGEFEIPQGCKGCGAIGVGAVLEAVDLKETPPSKQGQKLRDELGKRCLAGVDGSCEFATQQQCWRTELGKSE